MQLFRPEAMRGQDRLHGDVVLVPPVSWQLLGFFLLAAVLAAAAFLATARYSKVTTVSGQLVGDRGIVRARLAVPPAAAGFIEPGQKVRLAIDAFPSTTYGTVDARIETVSGAAVPIAANGRQAFIAEATLDRTSIRAFGRSRPLRAGMTLRAGITIRSRSLVELLFEPFYAAAP